jgi:hypothetical protein
VATPDDPVPSAPNDTRRRRAPLPVAAAVAALWAAVLTYGALLILAAVGGAWSGASASGVAKLAAAAWLLGHGVPVQAPADRITLVPLAVTALAVWRLARAGVHASRAVGGHRLRSPGRALGAGASVGIVYAAIGTFVAALTPVATPVRAALTLGLVAGTAATFGALRHSRAGRLLLARVPAVVMDAGRTGLAAAGVILAGGAAAAGVALALHGREAAEMLGSYRAGVLGQAGITLMCLAYLPNLSIWGAAYLLGPGFSVGVDTAVSPGQVLLGPVPALPVLAGLPDRPLSGVAVALLGVPLLAGAGTGWWLARRRRDTGWGGLLAAAALAGPVAGLVVQLAAFASAGGLGSGRLSQLGPSSARLGVVAAAAVGVAAVLGAVAVRALAQGRPTPERGPAGPRSDVVPAVRRSVAQ